MAQLTVTDVEFLQQEGATEGWTFEVSRNPATYRSLDSLSNLQIPEDWQASAQTQPPMPRAEPLGLPTSFDWRDFDGCTPVRNQASCGSCWAFATVGVLESAILIDSGVAQNLSEQYLVSCNRSGWSCNGGWFAHSYHYNTSGLDGGTGAVLEAAKPYTATNTACGGPHSHPYVVNSWAYVDPSVNVPATDAIKQAIMTYGPVSVAVAVNSAFQAYSSGVFNSCTSGTINHAVVLIGWDDADQAWIMRNSWGEYWGESGYMRIRYGCSSIGYAACYVDYGSGEATGAEITSPANGSTFSDTSVEFTWSGAEGATEYWLGIGDAIGKFNSYSRSQGTNTSVTVDRLAANGRPLYAKLFSKIDDAWYGHLYTYTSVTQPATKAAMTSPTAGSTLEDSSVTFEWSAGARVSEYSLWIGTTRAAYNLYNKSQGLNQTVTVTNLPAGGRTLYVRLFSKIAGVWQYNDYTYTSPTGTPEAAVMTAPENASTLEASTVTFTWSEGLGVTEYTLQLGTTAGGLQICKRAMGKAMSATVAGLPTNSSTLYVRLWSKCTGVWQYNDYQYTTASLTRGPAEMTSPENASVFTSNRVTFTWSTGTGVTEYKLNVGTTVGGYNLYNVSRGLNLSATVGGLPINGRTVYVRLWSKIAGVWQKRDYTYTAVTATASAGTMTSPTSGSTLTSSMATFEWAAGTGVTEYWLNIGTTLGGITLYNKSLGLSTSVTVTNLPTNGRTLYVRLSSKIGSTWQRRDYTYTAASTGTAKLISPP